MSRYPRLAGRRVLLCTALATLVGLSGCNAAGQAAQRQEHAQTDSARLASGWLQRWSALAERWEIDAPKLQSDDEFDPFGACSGCGCWSP